MIGAADEGAEEVNVLADNVSGMTGKGTRVITKFPEAEDVHVQRHQSANRGEPPLVPERPILRVLGVVWTLPFDQVRVCVRFGQEGQRRVLLFLRVWWI